MRTLKKVISGGQTGVDRAALRAASERGLEIGGWCPPGRVSEAGVIPAEFPLRETERERSPDAQDVPRSQRTEWNVRDSDGTLVIETANASRDAGTEWARKCAASYGKPFLDCDVADPNAAKNIRQWLGAFAVETLNVGGPSESAAPGIGENAYALLVRLFRHAD